MSKIIKETLSQEVEANTSLKSWLDDFIFNGGKNHLSSDRKPKRLAGSTSVLDKKSIDTLLHNCANKTEQKILVGMHCSTDLEFENLNHAVKMKKEITFKETTIAFTDEDSAREEAKEIVNKWSSSSQTIQNRTHDHISHGHAGIILSVTIKPNQAISIDEIGKALNKPIDRLPVGTFFLPAGTYEAVVKTIEKPWTNSIHKYNIEEELKSIKDLNGGRAPQTLDHQKLRFIEANFDLKNTSTEARHHVFKKLMAAGKNPELKVNFQNNQEQPFLDHDIDVKIGWGVPWMLFELYPVFSEEDQHALGLYLNKQLLRLTKIYRDEVKKLPEKLHKKWFKIELDPTIGMAIANDPVLEHAAGFIEDLNLELGKRYNHLNSYEEIKRLNSLADNREAMRRHVKEVEAALTQVISFKKKIR